MEGDSRGRQVMARIGFAERWLHRAKRHCGEGDVTRGLLTLALAQAEMHYAIETGGGRARAPRRAPTPALLAVGTVALAVVAASWLPPAPPMHGVVASVPIVKLVAPVGNWLELVQAPARPNSAALTRAAHAGQARPALHQPHASRSTALAVVPASSSAVAVPTPAALTVVPTPSAPPVALSAVDLIDLVLAADRTLRKVPANP